MIKKSLSKSGLFYTQKSLEYSQAQKECIENTLLKLLDEEHSNLDKPIMLLGKIQSGKTRTFIGVMSLAFDNGYDLCIVLTKGTNALSEQTFQRMNKEFNNFIQNDEVKVYDIMKMPDNLRKYELNQKIIIVVKKQHKNLPKLQEFISRYPIQASKKCLIIDDEADFSSIGFEKRKDETVDIRKIAGDINEIRGSLEHCNFIQVTATPYSLYLQPEDIEIPQITEIKPIKPAYTILVPEGEGYIGGDYYFLKSQDKNHPARYLFQEVSPIELEILRKPDKRRFKPEEALTSRRIITLRNAIMNFIVGGCIRIIQDELNQPQAKISKFSFIIHTETNKASHSWQEDVISVIIEYLQDLKDENLRVFDEFIWESYKNLERSINEYGFYMPSFSEVRKKVVESIENEYLNVTIVNSENDVKVMLDENGQLRLRTPLSVFVGGQILDRGITISNLIGFYYGRRPGIMQQDTVLQHSRMFGYRNKEDLAVTRFYTTKPLYDAMAKINELDAALREGFMNGKNENGVIFIQKDDSGKIIPCSPNKIYMSKTIAIKPFKRILPVGFSPLCKTKLEKITEDIDDIIQKYQSVHDKKSTCNISRNVAIDIIKLTYSSFDLENEFTLSEETMLACLNYITNNNIVKVLVRTDRNIKKYDKYGMIEDSPDTPKDELTRAREGAISDPVLIMLRENGKKEDGWSGCPFWWPILIAPSTTTTSVFAHDVAK